MISATGKEIVEIAEIRELPFIDSYASYLLPLFTTPSCPKNCHMSGNDKIKASIRSDFHLLSQSQNCLSRLEAEAGDQFI